MTTERINEISEYLARDLEKAKSLLESTPEEAAENLRVEGFDVTAEELIAYSEELIKIANEKDGELNEDDLENVAGGIAGSTVILIGMVIGFCVGKGVW